MLRDVGFFERVKGVEILCQREAISIDREQKTVRVRETDPGAESTLSYDKLVLATGGRPATPPIPGIDARGVQSFHSLRDAARLDTVLGEGSFIEGGLVGWPFELRVGA